MKLITWNIQSCRGCDGRVDPPRIMRHARALADFDVLCLQEVADNFPSLPGNTGEDQFELLAALAPGYTAIAGVAVDMLAPNGKRRRFGNMILSRYPVLQVLRIALPWPNDPKVASMPRLLIDATIASPIGELRVMTTHLEYYSAAQREAQVEMIRSHHAETCLRARSGRIKDDSEGPFDSYPPSASAILTGDFNFRPDDPLHARMQSAIAESTPAFTDAWLYTHPGEPHPHTLGVHDTKQWPSPYTCDFIFATQDLLPRLRAMKIDGATQASDHQPVLVELG